MQEWRRENLTNYFQINWNVFICITDRSMVLVKAQDETSALNSGIFLPVPRPPKQPKIHPHNTHLLPLLLYKKEEAFSCKNLSFLCALHGASARDLLQYLFSLPPHPSLFMSFLLLAYNTHALTSSSWSRIISLLQASVFWLIFSPTFSSIH